MPKKKEVVEKEPIDFDSVFESIKEPEEIRLSNIFSVIGFTPNAGNSELDGKIVYYDRSQYYEYLRWLRSQGLSEWNFR